MLLKEFLKYIYIAFDKTGTLTNGKLKVISVQSFDNELSEEKLMYYASSVEQRSEHPIGKAILSFFKLNCVDLAEPKDFTLLAGRGVRSFVDESDVIVGKEDLLNSVGINVPEKVKKASDLYLMKELLLFCWNNDKVAGFIVLSDTVREDAAKMITRLKELNIEPILLTGDNKSDKLHT